MFIFYFLIIKLLLCTYFIRFIVIFINIINSFIILFISRKLALDTFLNIKFWIKIERKEKKCSTKKT
jgi:hypothetical protein